jgi:hypothetical protein
MRIPGPCLVFGTSSATDVVGCNDYLDRAFDGHTVMGCRS